MMPFCILWLHYLHADHNVWNIQMSCSFLSVHFYHFRSGFCYVSYQINMSHVIHSIFPCHKQTVIETLICFYLIWGCKVVHFLYWSAKTDPSPLIGWAGYSAGRCTNRKGWQPFWVMSKRGLTNMSCAIALRGNKVVYSLTEDYLTRHKHTKAELNL